MNEPSVWSTKLIVEQIPDRKSGKKKAWQQQTREITFQNSKELQSTQLQNLKQLGSTPVGIMPHK